MKRFILSSLFFISFNIHAATITGIMDPADGNVKSTVVVSKNFQERLYFFGNSLQEANGHSLALRFSFKKIEVTFPALLDQNIVGVDLRNNSSLLQICNAGENKTKSITLLDSADGTVLAKNKRTTFNIDCN